MATVLSRSNARPSLMDQVRQLEREEAKTPRKQKLWPLMGYALKERLHAASCMLVTGGKTKGNK